MTRIRKSLVLRINYSWQTVIEKKKYHIIDMNVNSEVLTHYRIKTNTNLEQNINTAEHNHALSIIYMINKTSKL